MLDDMLDDMKTVRERPIWQHIPDQFKAHFNRPLPLDPQPPEEIYKEFLENVLPYRVTGTGHRRAIWNDYQRQVRSACSTNQSPQPPGRL